MKQRPNSTNSSNIEFIKDKIENYYKIYKNNKIIKDNKLNRVCEEKARAIA